jgi:hypothetical protein
MAALSAEQVAQIAFAAGFRGQALVDMVAIARRESGYRSDAHRTDRPGQQRTGDFGLWQVNYVNVPQLVQAGIINQASDLLDPAKNARAAFLLSGGGQNLRPWAAGPGGWNQAGDPFYGTNRNAAQAAVQRAEQQGLLGQDWAAPAAPATNQGGPVANSEGPFTLPNDAQLYNDGSKVYAAFDVGGVLIAYEVTWNNGTVDLQGRPQTTVSPDQWQQLNAVNAGNAEELRGFSVTYGGSFRAFFDSVLDQVMGKNNPARNDPEVLRVLADFAGRPDMTAAELQNKLQATQWFQARTTSELEWNSLAEAEKVKRRDDAAARMVNTWFQFTGEAIAMDDPRIMNYLEDVASGKSGIGAWTENVVKRAATDNGESPWSRQVRDEQESQRQRGIDVENTAQRLGDLARRWGLRFGIDSLQNWARAVTEKTMSEQDILELFKNQAQVLYPWKDREMETQTAAQQWIETYNRVMEKPGDIFNPAVQGALTKGQTILDFEQELKRSNEWLNTRNAREEMYSVVSETGRRLGFES